MGFHVTTLHNLPVGGIDYFVHVFDLSNGAHAKWINANLSTLAVSFGRNAGLVTGPGDLSHELYSFLSRTLVSDFAAVERLLCSTTCLLISEGHLAHTKRPIYLIPIATPDESPGAQELIAALIQSVATALQAGGLRKLVEEMGAIELELREADGGLLVCTLRRLNKVVELKPNVAGMGVNLNAMIENMLPPEKRPI